METRDVRERMRADWNARANEDANYFVAFGRREQDDAEFQATAEGVIPSLERELRRLRPGERGAALEIGCGPGRLMLPLSRYFAEIHGVDISDEMVRRAEARLAPIPNAHVTVNDGAGLQDFASDSFDFIYSYAVFQHIPSREVVLNYLREAYCVLKPGGFLRCQINGLPVPAALTTPSGLPASPNTQPTARAYDTWAGVRFSGAEVAAFAREQGMQLLSLEGERTQYMWTTMRKPRGHARPTADGRMRRVSRVSPLAASRGRYACVSVWIEDLPEACDLNDLEASVDGRPARPFYVGPFEVDGSQQLIIAVPEASRTGLLPVEVRWLDRPLIETVWQRVVPPGPSVPRLISVTDGVELLSARIVSGTVKLMLEEVDEPEKLAARIDDDPASEIQYLCVDPIPPRYEVNVHLPGHVASGLHQLLVEIGNRRLAPIPIEVAR